QFTRAAMARQWSAHRRHTPAQASIPSISPQLSAHHGVERDRYEMWTGPVHLRSSPARFAGPHRDSHRQMRVVGVASTVAPPAATTVRYESATPAPVTGHGRAGKFFHTRVDKRWAPAFPGAAAACAE